jgi:hypothetical protein
MRCFVGLKGNGRTERGYSVLIILALLAWMAIILAANSSTLQLLSDELKLINHQQLQKYGQSLRN